MRICATCNCENEEPSRFCEQCGAVLEPEASQPTEAVTAAAVAAQRPCPACNWAMSAFTRFCTHCGQRMPPPGPSAGRACPGCSSSIAETDFFCGFCGMKLSPADESAVTDPLGTMPLKTSETARLLVLAGREKDKVYFLGASGVRVGRARDNDISLETDGYVSSTHVRIYVQGGDYYIEDAGSVNGTFLKLRGPWRLQSGDEVKVGQSVFRFEPGSKQS